MNVESHFDAWIGLVGVLVGFLLVVVYDAIKEWKRRRRIRKALNDELTSNLRILVLKAHILEQALKAMSDNQILETAGVPFVTGIFENHYAEIRMDLSPKDRNLLHVIYGYFAVIDASMRQFGEDAADVRDDKGLKLVFQRYASKFGDLKSLVKNCTPMLESYLGGDPMDVLYLNIPLEEFRHAKIQPPPK